MTAMDVSDGEYGIPGQRRTRVACRRCNSKKIKCSAQRGVPCKGCASTNTDCVLIESQRGRYIRKGSRARNARLSRVSESDRVIPGFDRSSALPTGGVDHVSQSGVTLPPEDVVSSSFQEARDAADQDSDRRFYLHIADQGVSSTPRPISREKSTLFLGESFSLTYVVHDVLAPFLSTACAPNYSRRLHFPVDEGSDPSIQGQQNMVEAQIKLLQSRNLLFQPDQRASEQLLAGYFKWFHPAFPVLEKFSFLQICSENKLSLLVLNAVFMIAVTVCEEADLALLGFQDRHKARESFYNQARALYETDSDRDKLNNVVAVFLLSFWWGGPNDQKDSWHWLGIAVSSAQNLGMHRSTAKSHMSSHRTRMWRRIWWCLRMRDVLVSSSIGRPQHFSMFDCDVEMLSPHDLAGESLSEPEVQYACQMAHLSTIFSNIVSSRYAAFKPDHPAQKKIHLEKELDDFRLQMPAFLRYTGIGLDGKICLWSAMLLMAYNFGMILLCRPPHSDGTDTSQFWGNHPKSLAAAIEVTRATEDILSLSMGKVCQIHTIPALFNSLSIHVFTICTSRAIGRELAENRARTCMLGLTSLQESWPVSGWILRLFVNIMERLKHTSKPPTAPDLRSGLMHCASIPQNYTSATNTPGRVPDGMSIPAQQTWASSPALGNIFENIDIFPDMFGPNMFVPDQYHVGQEDGQADFFDLLRLPDWDNKAT